MTDFAKKDLNQLYREVISYEDGPEAWLVWLKKIRAEYPEIDQISPVSARYEEFMKRMQPLFDEYVAHRHALQRIENGAAEYEEIMGLSQ